MSWSYSGKKPAKIAWSTVKVRPGAGVGMDSLDNMECRSLKPLFSACSMRLRNALMASSISSWSGRACMFSSSYGSGAWQGPDCCAGISRLPSRKPEVTRLCLDQTRLSQVIPLNLIRYLVLTGVILRYPTLYTKQL